MGRNDLDKRYECDPDFHRVTNILHDLMMSKAATLTPLDIQDALFLARLRFEMNKGTHEIRFSKDMKDKLDFILSTQEHEDYLREKTIK